MWTNSDICQLRHDIGFQLSAGGFRQLLFAEQAEQRGDQFRHEDDADDDAICLLTEFRHLVRSLLGDIALGKGRRTDNSITPHHPDSSGPLGSRTIP
jgi:hypothetical protein